MRKPGKGKNVVVIFAAAIFLAGCEPSSSYNECLIRGLPNVEVQEAIEEIKEACARQFSEDLPRGALKTVDVNVFEIPSPGVNIFNTGPKWLIESVSILVEDKNGKRRRTFVWHAPRLLSQDDHATIYFEEDFPIAGRDSVNARVVSGTGVWLGQPRTMWERMKGVLD